jgi:hypothetical protein
MLLWRVLKCVVSIALVGTAAFGAVSNFDSDRNTWTLSSSAMRAVFQWTPDSRLIAQSLSNLATGDTWTVIGAASPIRFATDSDLFDGNRQFTLVSRRSDSIAPSGVRESIVLDDAAGAGRITVLLEVYDDQPVLRYSLIYTNRSAIPAYLGLIDMLPWLFDGAGQRYTAMRVNNWSVAPVVTNFETATSVLEPGGAAFEVFSGAHGQQCGWLALRDARDRGLFAGWEFDGRAQATVRQNEATGSVQFSSTIIDLHHPVQPGANFQTPWGFIGLFHGDFDEAGYRTQRFSEAVLAKHPADGSTLPYVAWDSWAYGEDLGENTLRREADIAASLGVELYIIDLGWARSIGDWYEDSAKFPHGLAALSAYVHSLGMKFGLHFALTEANPASPVLQSNPDWTSTENDNYHGAASLCLSHQPAHDWLVEQGIRMIDDYGVDWILQDGENMVKQCSRSGHTHDAADSNYANAVDGLNSVVSAIRQARPSVMWENCEDGGNMMTFNMVKSYVTSATNDASGAFDSRKAVYGATFPFSPRYADRYMPPQDGVSDYSAGSYRFGGNWVLMDRLASLGADQLGLLGHQILNYKRLRGAIDSGKVFHILAPGAGPVDVIQSYNPDRDSAMAVVTRAGNASAEYILKPQGLIPDQRYTVWFENNTFSYSMPGAQLTSSGVRVVLPDTQTAEVVHVDHQ